MNLNARIVEQSSNTCNSGKMTMMHPALLVAKMIRKGYCQLFLPDPHQVKIPLHLQNQLHAVLQAGFPEPIKPRP